MKSTLFIFLSLFLLLPLIAQNDPEPDLSEYDEEQLQAMYQAYVDSVCNTFQYQTGAVELLDGLATLEVPPGYKYLDGPSSDIVLEDLWGNPPSEGEDRSLGMLFPENSLPNDSLFTYAIDITYSEEGFIDDSDAQDLDYDELLETMQDDMVAANEQRVEMGYERVELVGWASKPYYDEENKKLHWAKELRFGDAAENTLNYNIRILGRKGYLMLNAISDMSVYPAVKDNIGPILSSVEFNEGHTYADYDPSIDKVAAVGIGGLIAGKVLAKAGIFAKIGLLLAKFWKVIAIGAVAAMAGLRKFMGGKRDAGPEKNAPAA